MKEKTKDNISNEEIRDNRDVAISILKAENDFFVDIDIEEKQDSIEIKYNIEDNLYEFEDVLFLEREEKLRHLINVAKNYKEIENTNFTLKLRPDNIYFTMNAIPKFLKRGLVARLYPYEKMTNEEFLRAFKSLIISTLDKKKSFEDLLNGQLEFYEGDLLAEEILAAEEYSEIMDNLEKNYYLEKEKNQDEYTKISKKKSMTLNMTTVISSIIAVVSISAIMYLLLIYVPRLETISSIRLNFSKNNYSDVVTYSKDIADENLIADDKYMVAYSVIMTEDLNDEQKENLSNISSSSNDSYLRYWISIGKADIDEAIDIASFLDEPQLLMYGMTKKIDELQRNPDLSSEERTSQIDSYKSKLEDLKEKYFNTEEEEEVEETEEVEGTEEVENVDGQ